MNFRQSMLSAVSLTILVGITTAAQAHRAWILPSSTNLSSDTGWVSFDAAVSNTLFVPEHKPLSTENIQVISPDGELVNIENSHTGKFRSSFDINLLSQGTYKIGYGTRQLRAVWKDEEGKRVRWPGRGKTADLDDFEKTVPKQADSLEIYQNYWRLETFVTLGEPTSVVFTANDSGLVLVPVTHPNDLFVGETAKFKLMFEGEPAANAKVSLVAGHMRYRNQQERIDLVADKDGYISVNWPHAGMYLMEAEFSDDKASAPATTRRGSYSATFEVLPL